MSCCFNDSPGVKPSLWTYHTRPASYHTSVTWDRKQEMKPFEGKRVLNPDKPSKSTGVPVFCCSRLHLPRPVCPLAAASPPPLPSSPLPVLPVSSLSSPLTSWPAAFALPVWLLVYFVRRGSACTCRCRWSAQPGGTSRPPGSAESDPGPGTAAQGRCSVCSAARGIRRRKWFLKCGCLGAPMGWYQPASPLWPLALSVWSPFPILWPAASGTRPVRPTQPAAAWQWPGVSSPLLSVGINQKTITIRIPVGAKCQFKLYWK